MSTLIYRHCLQNSVWNRNYSHHIYIKVQFSSHMQEIMLDIKPWDYFSTFPCLHVPTVFLFFFYHSLYEMDAAAGLWSSIWWLIWAFGCLQLSFLHFWMKQKTPLTWLQRIPPKITPCFSLHGDINYKMKIMLHYVAI